MLKLITFGHGLYVRQLLQLESFFIDLGLEQLESVFVLGE